MTPENFVTLYVGGIDFNITEAEATEDLKMFFGADNVQSFSLRTDKENPNRSLGYGFMTIKKSEAEKAIGEYNYYGRTLKISLVIQRKKENSKNGTN
jgi:hypothetical protein